MEKGSEVVPREPAGQPAVPEFIKKGDEGFENLRPQDLVLPRLVLLQALSPSVVAKFPRGEPGNVINSLTGDLWLSSDDVAEFIPLFHYLEWIEWGDRDKNEGIKNRSMDASSALALRAKDQERDENGHFAVTEYHNFVAIFPVHGENQMVVISCAKTNYKKARKLLALARYRGPYPLFAGKYQLSTKVETNRTNKTYYVFEFENSGWCPEGLFDACKEMYEHIKSARTVMVDQTAEDDAGTEHVDAEL
jgi:hypothetical protein